MSKPMALVGRKHPALHEPAEPVEDFEKAVWLAERMIATVRVKRGVALAAPQVGQRLQLFVQRDGTGFANPEIVANNGAAIFTDEACLTIPGRVFEVPRWAEVTVAATSLQGDRFQFDIDDAFVARMWQHEVDHLNGVLISDEYPEVRRRA